MQARKQKFQGEKTKWEKRRIARTFARIAQGKKPLAEPLTIAPAEERQAALKQGKMVFYNGNEKITISLLRNFNEKRISLQGIYKTHNGRIIILRADPLMPGSKRHLWLFELTKFFGKLPMETLSPIGFYAMNRDIGHFSMQGAAGLWFQGLAKKGVSKAERHRRALNKGKHRFVFMADVVPSGFPRFFERLGYSRIGGDPDRPVMKKKGKFQSKDNLNKFHRIEAIDQKTGKTKTFTFPIKK